MAEKTEKKPEAAASGEKKDPKSAPAAKAAAPVAGAGKGGGFMTKMPVLLGGVMILEAVVLFAGFKFLGSGAKNANAADLTTDISKKDDDGDKTGPADAGKTVEVELLDGKFPNKQNGRTFLYDVHFRLSVKTDAADKVKKIITDRSALIEDRIRTIIAQSDPDKLQGGSEPGLETLKRQVKYQLDEIVGDGLIDEVLVPQCIGFRTDY
jgi:flagellar basal body-associated protein FliL